jgi:hypothetical protein
VLAAPDRGKKYLRVAINHALSAAKRGTLEGRFISLCRAYEALCRHHGFINQNLAARLEPAQQAAEKTPLREVAGKVRAMRDAEPDPGRKAVPDTIAGRGLGAAQTEKSFGLAVADLAQEFGSHDAQVVDAHLATHPHPTGKTWPGLLTHYRAAATHDAYFDFAQRQDLSTILRLMNHLHDLLLRVLLRTVGYDGPYQSPIPPVMQRDSLDWVRPKTPAGLLGYACTAGCRSPRWHGGGTGTGRCGPVSRRPGPPAGSPSRVSSTAAPWTAPSRGAPAGCHGDGKGIRPGSAPRPCHDSGCPAPFPMAVLFSALWVHLTRRLWLARGIPR